MCTTPPAFLRTFIMASSQYRIERSQPLRGSLLPPQSFREFYNDRGLAVAVAVKSLADPTRQRIRVVHVDSGEVVFDTRPPAREHAA
ncbi:MAG: hypothetical protein KAY33_00130 [Polaromonas sp.]|jgi:hypothetical protein|nr:hypothetical protein [Polaromonas sp.]